MTKKQLREELAECRPTFTTGSIPASIRDLQQTVDQLIEVVHHVIDKLPEDMEDIDGTDDRQSER